jgi:hypothetical protein
VAIALAGAGELDHGILSLFNHRGRRISDRARAPVGQEHLRRVYPQEEHISGSGF